MESGWISLDQVSNLNASVGDIPRLREQLAQLFVPTATYGFCGSPVSVENTALLTDIYFYAFACAKTNNFSVRQIAAFLTLLRDVVDSDCDSGMSSFNESFDRFQTRLLRLSADRPPISLGVFSTTEARYIVNFMMENYYRQFKLYKSCFIPKRYVNLKQVLPCSVEKATVPRPLREGLIVKPALSGTVKDIE